MNTNPAGKGILTSEFLVTLLGGIASFLISQGVPSHTANILLDNVIAVYKGLVALVAIILIVKQYIQSRTEIKKTLLDNSTKII